MSRPLIHDCVPFFNEIDILRARLIELDPVVDHFVVVEATRSHQGGEKPLRFDAHRSEFAPYLRKLDYVVVRDLPVHDDPLVAEVYQRNALLRALGDAADDDTVIISDVDEIPRREAIASLAPPAMGCVVALEMRMFFYGRNWELPVRWRHARAVSRGTLRVLTPEEVRLGRTTSTLLDAGWHFSYFYPRDALMEGIREKARAFLHSELATEDRLHAGHLARCIGGGLSWCDEPPYQTKLRYVAPDESFPAAFRELPDVYERYLIRPEERERRLESLAWTLHAITRAQAILSRRPPLSPLARPLRWLLSSVDAQANRVLTDSDWK
jgi:Glycosyltransferase family 17